MKTSVTTHHYRASDIPDDSFGRHYCACGALESNPRHDVPEPTAEVTRVSLRIVGEHERSDE